MRLPACMHRCGAMRTSNLRRGMSVLPGFLESPGPMPNCSPSTPTRSVPECPMTTWRSARAFAPVIERWFTNQPGPWTVTHGDFRLDNMLFEIRNGAEPIGVVDWQTILVGPGTVDVSYFIGASLPTEVRRASEKDLVRRYHNGLLERGVPDYSFEQCWNNYRYSAFHGYFMATYAPLLVQRTERGDAMFALWVERVAAQLRDLDSLSVLAQI
ncbi:phosphotransferase [Rhodococcus zopfii]|uniref:Phosphotransferase n=1 Tax=Rhodococcus zopfii TaxID=43772 RepID=A0ABU3WYL1_9NOCA|nr:phosphotransferase [Rhodococcus zopfii]